MSDDNLNVNNEEQTQTQKPKSKFKIPGFRSGKTWKKVVACIGYAFIALFIIALNSSPSDTTNTTAKTTQQESKDYYQEGIKAFNTQDWNKAESALKKVKSSDKNYNDAQIKLKEVNSHLADSSLQKAKDILASGNLTEELYNNAILALNMAIHYNPDLTEAKDLKPQVEQQKQAYIQQKKQQEIVNYKNECQAMEYKVLNKNPNSLINQKVKLHGEIMQIQEDSTGTFMLIEVTHKGYDIWTDTVAVIYLDKIDIYEDDKITLWGEIRGEFNYKSRAGWDMTVPSVKAEYIEKGLI